MTAADPSQFLGDPLSPIARQERRNLLIGSTVGMLVAHAGLVPTRISALGLELSVPEQSAFLVVLALMLLYLISAFMIYSLADFFVWRKRYYDYQVAVEQEGSRWTPEDQQDYDDLARRVPSIGWYFEKAPLVAYLRVFFEFYLPLAVGLYAAGRLMVTAWSL